MCIKERIIKHAEQFNSDETHIKRLKKSILELADTMQATEIILEGVTLDDDTKAANMGRLSSPHRNK